MAIFSVHLPDKATPDLVAERAVFVRDGFALWAMLLGPLWFLRHREWLGLVGWLPQEHDRVPGETVGQYVARRTGCTAATAAMVVRPRDACSSLAAVGPPAP